MIRGRAYVSRQSSKTLFVPITCQGPDSEMVETADRNINEQTEGETELSPEDLGRLSAEISQDPDNSQQILSERGLTEEQFTRDGEIIGTVPYMAPEQITGEPAGTAADIFSLGVVIYEMVRGRRPFGGDTTAAVLHSILHDPMPPLPSSVMPLISVERLLGSKRFVSRFGRDRSGGEATFHEGP